MINNCRAIIDFGSKNLTLNLFDQDQQNIYSSQEIVDDSLDKSLEIIIKDAEKKISTHIDNVIVLYDSQKFYSLDISIKKVFDEIVSIKKIYDSLIEEAHYLISQNNFKDQIVHLVINNIVVDDTINLEKIKDDIKIKSLTLEIKFICINKIFIKEIINRFKKKNLKVLNIYCTSYVKAHYYKKRLVDNDFSFFLDIGFERSTGLIFQNNKFIFFKSIPIGGNNITKDISKVLNLSLEYSENLKLKFNQLENNQTFSKKKSKEINPYNEVLEKNISTDLLKQIIKARIEEIIELAFLESNFLKNLNLSSKQKLIPYGGGSKLILHNYNFPFNHIFSEFITCDLSNPIVGAAGFQYHNTVESDFVKSKKKIKKQGFFENFFNLFSK